MPRFTGGKAFQHEIFSRQIGEMRNLLQVLELRDIFEDSENRPKMDMYETRQEIVIEFDLPGFEIENITLKICGLTLLLEAFKPREQNIGTFICVERSYGTFKHAVLFPVNIDTRSITAEYRLGVLRVVCFKCDELTVPIKEISD